MIPYLVIVEKTDTGFSSHVPDLPGCVATGATLDEIEKNTTEAVNFHVAGLIRSSQPIPSLKTYGYFLSGL